MVYLNEAVLILLVFLSFYHSLPVLTVVADRIAQTSLALPAANKHNVNSHYAQRPYDDII